MPHLRRVQRTQALLEKTWPERPESAGVVPWRVSERLGRDELRELATSYQAGATGPQLAERYGLARSTVIALLRESGVTIRQRALITGEELARIVALYQQGVRQIDIAEQMGRSKSAVWHALRRAGQL